MSAKTALNTKVTEVESKRSDITNLATKAALNTKAREIENNVTDTTSFITIPEFNRLAKLSFDARIKRKQKILQAKVKQVMLLL